MTKRRPDPNRPTLLKMAHATRTFWTQNEALQFIIDRQKKEKAINSVIMKSISSEKLIRSFLFFIREKSYICSVLNHNRVEHDDIRLLISIFSFMNISKFHFRL
jgi:hypothetical protein